MKVEGIDPAGDGKVRKAMMAAYQSSLEPTKKGSDFNRSKHTPQPKTSATEASHAHLLQSDAELSDGAQKPKFKLVHEKYEARVERLIVRTDRKEDRQIGSEKEARQRMQQTLAQQKDVENKTENTIMAKPNEDTIANSPDKFKAMHGFLPKISDNEPSSGQRIESDKEGQNSGQEDDEQDTVEEDEEPTTQNEAPDDNFDPENAK